MPHTIRLRAPWHVSRIHCQAVVLKRWFHCPTGLRADDHVWLVVEGLRHVERITLNDQPLHVSCDATGILRCEVRPHLTPRNEIMIEVVLDGQQTHDEAMARIERQVLAAGLVRIEISERA